MLFIFIDNRINSIIHMHKPINSTIAMFFFAENKKPIVVSGFTNEYSNIT